MKIEVAKVAGFCFGVSRIIKMAEELLEKANGSAVYCLGELIHNPQEVNRIKAQGMKFIANPQELPLLQDSSPRQVLIRAHGVSPKVVEEIRAKGYEIIDGTCPLVKAAHHKALQLVQEGYRLVILGHEDHPEVQGILGEVQSFPGAKVDIDIISSSEEVERLDFRPADRVGLISQTTQTYERFAQVITELLPRVLEVKAYNTICQATFARQAAVRELARYSDVVVVIGGHNSSNTNSLAEIAAEYTECYHIESPDQLKGEWFKGKQKIGISAGASTPNWCIQEVKEAIKRLVGEK